MNTKTIARNSLWHGIEMAADVLCGLVTSIAIARVIGPQKLGPFLYIAWLTNIARLLGGLGIHTATRKYMAEYLGNGQPGVARAIFYRSLRLQSMVALFTTLAGLALVLLFGEPSLRLTSLALVVSMLPGMVVAIPSQANMAAENMAANVPSSLIANAVYVIAVILSLTLGWGLAGIACGMLVMKTAELTSRLLPALAWMRSLPRGDLPPGLSRSMFVYSRQSLALLLVNVVVWDRSEIIFLKNFCADIRQVTFYLLAFNLTERILLVPSVLGEATGATLMAQYGRDQRRLAPMVSAATRYLALLAMPLHLGLAAISGPLITLLYGQQYLPAIPVLALAASLGLGKAFLLPAQHSLQATEHQGFLVRWSLLTAALNLLLDWLLIPQFGAVGASLANGTAQLFAVVGLWAKLADLMPIRLPKASLTKVAISGLAMAAVLLLLRGLQPLAAVSAGALLSALVFAAALRLTGALDGEDRERLLQLGRQLPCRIQTWFDWGLGWLAPATRSSSSLA